nr:MAG TPA: hypothetical protein [Bacteriophage sp.]
MQIINMYKNSLQIQMEILIKLHLIKRMIQQNCIIII